MHAKKPVTVVNIISPSYTGTTWLGLLLGCHARAFSLGPPDRVWTLAREGGPNGGSKDEACRVHGCDCPFWSGFLETYDRGDNLYVQLAEASGRDVIVINNPTREHTAAELGHPDLVVKPIRIVRDGRALACSYARHHDVDFFDAVYGYVRHLYRSFPFDPDDPDEPALRYEDVVSDQAGHLASIGAYLGLEYDPAATRFWEFEHHVTAGNAGAIGLLKSFQGLGEKAFRKRPFYREQFERMRDEGAAFLDERWKEDLGRRERFLFDDFCGSGNAKWGYDEDAFSASERSRFERELSAELRPVARWLGERRAALGTAWRRIAQETIDRLPRSRRKRLAIACAAWIVSLGVTWLIAAWVTGR